jgi:hypothetical protein
MKYREYLDTAKRHLTTCRKFFDSINWADYPQKDDLSREKEKLSIERKKLTEKKISLDCKKNELLKELNDLKEHKSNLTEEKKQPLETKKRQLENDELLLSEQFSQLSEKEVWHRRKQNLLKEKECRLKDIYYLSGYILEAFTVFIVYKTGYEHIKKIDKEFNPNEHHIDEFNKEFTKHMHVDFYPKIRNPNTKKYCTNRKYYNIKRDPITKIAQDPIHAEDENFLNKQHDLCGINQHKFSKIVQKVIKGNLGLFDSTIPINKHIPYFRESISKELETLINSWQSSLRYSDPSEWNETKELLNESSLKQLLNICQEIDEKIGHL